jgi:protein-disulfide isomerase
VVKPQLVEEYVGTGEVLFEYRDYAFRGPDAVRAAEASFCAAEQDGFWQFHDTIFENQSRLLNAGGGYSPEALRAMAEGVGLDLPAYDACMASEAPDAAVAADFEEAKGMGVNGTPALFVNGQPVAGNGWEDLKAAIDAALAAGPATPAAGATPQP